MIRALLVVAAASVTCATFESSLRYSREDDVQLDNNVAAVMFETFQKDFAKTYSSAEARKTAFEHFKVNVKKLVFDRESGKAGVNANLGITKFFDMKTSEVHNHKCGGVLTGRISHPVTPVAKMPAPVALPKSWDWSTQGAVTPVQDQGSCGSCWAFSTVGALEGSNFLANKKLVKLSEQEFVDCSQSNFGCSGGWPFTALSDVLTGSEAGSVDTETNYPYAGTNQNCAWSKAGTGATFVNYKSYCNENTANCTEVQMQQLLYQLGPLSACLDAEPFFSYQSGVLKPADCDPTQIDHCITIVGYGTDEASGEAFWKIKNSWGPSWGEDGYVRLFRGSGICGINRVITLPQFSTK